MRRFLIFYFPLLLLFSSCSSTPPEWQAASAAKDYYDCLKEGDAVGFLEGKAGAGSLAADYGEQLLTAVRQYHADLQKKHGGLREVCISEEHYKQNLEDCRDTVLHLTYAYLILCFGDSTQEEVMVPMTEHNGRWLMK